MRKQKGHYVWHLVSLQKMLVTAIADSVRFFTCTLLFSTVIKEPHFNIHYMYYHLNYFIFLLGSFFWALIISEYVCEGIYYRKFLKILTVIYMQSISTLYIGKPFFRSSCSHEVTKQALLASPRHTWPNRSTESVTLRKRPETSAEGHSWGTPGLAPGITSSRLSDTPASSGIPAT